MGLEYALVHLKYTIPPGVLLTLLSRPFLSRLDLYKVFILVTCAILSTIPWDSYLIRHRIWTYPPHVTIGLNLCSIPVEEVFFFFIQTYNTSLLFLLLNKPLFHPSYIRRSAGDSPFSRRVIQIIMILLYIVAIALFKRGGEGTYLALILLWALPFTFLLWSLSSQFFINLPYTSTIAPILVPTFYLWLVDTIALRKGTWNIEPGTKFSMYLWEGLDIEEAIFFLVTNILVVLGLVAIDYSVTITLTSPTRFAELSDFLSPHLLMKALLADRSISDEKRISGIHEAVEKLRKKSRSFYLASATFTGRLRIDLVLLYAFCRVADDLVDKSKTAADARGWIDKLTKFLDLSYSIGRDQELTHRQELDKFITENFPQSTTFALHLLPSHLLSSKPLYELLEGFKTDLEFLETDSMEYSKQFPIIDERDLEDYAARVAGTVAELCLEFVFHHDHSQAPSVLKHKLLQAGKRMGIALQYVNIARDIEVDARIGRIYLPTSWLKEEDLSHSQVLRQPAGLAIEKLRSRLLDKAFDSYHGARGDISQIPLIARAPIRVAVESYMEIGRVLKERTYLVEKGRATVPKWRRLKVALNALRET